MLVDTCVKKTFRLPGNQPIMGWTPDNKHHAFEKVDLEPWLASERLKWFYSPTNDVYIIFLDIMFEDEGEWVDSIRALCEDGEGRRTYPLYSKRG
jgi:hypothetical protein